MMTSYGLDHGATELNPLYNQQNLAGKILAPVVLAMSWLPAYQISEKNGFKKALKLLDGILAVLLGIYVAVVVNNTFNLILIFL